MMKCASIVDLFRKGGFSFFTGVPCSIFKDLINCLIDSNKFQHIIATSEGEAVAIATGYYLATGNIPVVYMQNSGFANSANPLTSLTNREVFGIPVLLLISWRGEPRIKDEPEHVKMGKITPKLLETLEVPWELLPKNLDASSQILKQAKNFMRTNKEPFAVIVRKGVIGGYTQNKSDNDGDKDVHISREEALKIVVDRVYGKGVVVSTTGKISREIFEYVENSGRDHNRIFYTVGSMGCSTGISLGLSLRSKNKIFLFDGDGAALMRLGSITTVGYYQPGNFFHILFDNSSYDSTGGQPTISKTVDFVQIAKSCGYRQSKIVTKFKELKEVLENLLKEKGPYMLVIKIKPGARQDLGRPTIKPSENKEKFMNFLKKENEENK